MVFGWSLLIDDKNSCEPDNFRLVEDGFKVFLLAWSVGVKVGAWVF